MELTPEERRRIYEEERVRIETAHRPTMAPAKHEESTFSKSVGSAAYVLAAICALGVAYYAMTAAKKVDPGFDQSAADASLARVKELAGRIGELRSVRVDDKWTWNVRDEYDYVRGSVKNHGKRTARYWKLRVDFFDSSGSVIDSDFTNSADRLMPGASRQFEVMHRNIPAARKAQVEMEEVAFDD